MKLLILAAGRGTRISRYISGNPKCTVNIGDTSLLKYTLNLFRSKGINDIGIVLGYKHEEIQKLLCDENTKQYYNPFFDVTNSIASAWFGRAFITPDEDILIMNGDVFLEPDIVDFVKATAESPVLFADESRKTEADYKFYYENNLLLKHGKELESDDITAEYVGIAKIEKSFVPKFVAQLERMINEQKHSVWWENVLYEMIGERNIYVKDVHGRFWAEVDFLEDYERILQFRNYFLDLDGKVHKRKTAGL